MWRILEEEVRGKRSTHGQQHGGVLTHSEAPVLGGQAPSTRGTQLRCTATYLPGAGSPGTWTAAPWLRPQRVQLLTGLCSGNASTNRKGYSLSLHDC